MIRIGSIVVLIIVVAILYIAVRNLRKRKSPACFIDSDLFTEKDKENFPEPLKSCKTCPNAVDCLGCDFNIKEERELEDQEYTL
ncbi:MAG: hypothetical protein MJ189_00055 [Coriobacteriales bacterium]|nr:hypothetical protein [Coriobacteriales bacterium]